MLKLGYHRGVHLLWVVPIGVFIVSAIVLTTVADSITSGSNTAAVVGLIAGTLLTISPIALIVGAIVAYNALKKRRQYEAQVAEWNGAVRYSDPSVVITPGFDMLPEEVAYYSMTSQRYAERWVSQQIQTTTGGGLVPAIVGGVAFGAAGAVAGAVIGKKSTSGTATNVYDVVVVDTGVLTVTNRRYLFLGARNTVIVQKENLIRVSTPQPHYLVLEYEGRPAGESFTVQRYAFRMSMVRRANDPKFSLPTWPGPIVADPPEGMTMPYQIDGVLPAPPVPSMDCPTCGKRVPDAAVACWNCRTQLRTSLPRTSAT